MKRRKFENFSSSGLSLGLTFYVIIWTSIICKTVGEEKFKSTSVTTESTTTSAVSHCSPGLCQNGGTCILNGCQRNQKVCCNCPRGFVGQFCQRKRQAVFRMKTRNPNYQYTPDLADKRSVRFLEMQLIICNLLIDLIRKAYPNAIVQCIILSFSPGSVISDSSLEYANNDKESAPTPSDLAARLESYCSRSTSNCSSVAPAYGSYSSSVKEMNVCQDVRLHSCSVHASCVNKGGGEYECTCNTGYTDSGQQAGGNTGRVCTEPCTNNRYCLNGGLCVENIGKTKSCQCLTGYEGNQCQTRSESLTQADRNMIIIGVVLCTVELVLLITLVVLHIRRKNLRRQRESENEIYSF